MLPIIGALAPLATQVVGGVLGNVVGNVGGKASGAAPAQAGNPVAALADPVKLVSSIATGALGQIAGKAAALL